MKPGVLLASGGIDSTVLAHVLHECDALVSMYFVDYGQASAKDQWSSVVDTATRLDVPSARVELSLPGYMQGSGAVFGWRDPKPQLDPYSPLTMGSEEYTEYLRDVWDIIPARNSLFVLYGAAFALSVGADRLYAAFQFDAPEWDVMDRTGVEAFVGCDTSPLFVHAMNELLRRGGLHKAMTVDAPFLDQRWTKQMVVDAARDMGVDLHPTYSCEFFPECGECRQCVVRNRLL